MLEENLACKYLSVSNREYTTFIKRDLKMRKKCMNEREIIFIVVKLAKLKQVVPRNIKCMTDDALQKFLS
jgi:hypothetical protein